MFKNFRSDRWKRKDGILKIFCDELNPLILSKTLHLSINDTTEKVVEKILENVQFTNVNPREYCLIKIIIPTNDQIQKRIIQEFILDDKECPLNIYLNHIQNRQGLISFRITKCPLEYVEIRQEYRGQQRAIEIKDFLSTFVEVNSNGTNILTPRVFKLSPNTTYVGCDTRNYFDKRYFYINGVDIDRNHCIIEYKNGVATLIPKGKILLNGKLCSTPFILQHTALISFGDNTTYRYYDPTIVIKSISIKINEINKRKLMSYSSLPNLLPSNIQSNMLHEKSSSSMSFVQTETKLDVLPGLLEVSNRVQNRFLYVVFHNYPLNKMHFRLSPAYILYMTLRHRLTLYDQSHDNIISLLYSIENLIIKKTEDCREQAGYLAYWLANVSEYIHFIKSDRDLSKISFKIEINLTESIQNIYDYMINQFQNELNKYLVALIDNNDYIENNFEVNVKSTEMRWIVPNEKAYEYQNSTLSDIIQTLSSIMNLLRICRVHAGITVQIFSQLFHYINAWLFNRIVCCPQLKLCSSIWAEKILIRLKAIYDWADRQGLELASEYHFMKINQLCALLKCPKTDIGDIKNFLSNNKIIINSVQLNQIFNNYILNRNEPPISNRFSQILLSIAYKYVDESLSQDGIIIQLAEHMNLNLPLDLPEDGYVFETLCGIPKPLLDFIEPISKIGLCRLLINPRSLGMWTEYIQHDIDTIILNKKDNTLGLSIVSIKVNQTNPLQGIYVKDIIADGTADIDKRLKVGDQILSANNISLINKTLDEAIEILNQCGQKVTLKIWKNAAVYHGFSSIFLTSLNQHHSSKNHSIIYREDIPPEEINSSMTNSVNYQWNGASRLTKETLSPTPRLQDNLQKISQEKINEKIEFDERLKRRLEQYEIDRNLEKQNVKRILAKQHVENQTNLRKDQERESRANRELEEFKNQRMSERAQAFDAKREQTRLLKHIVNNSSSSFKF